MDNLASSFGNGFMGLSLLSPYKTRSISAENPTGEVGGGARAIPEPGSPAYGLGQGWKVRPAIDLPVGEETTIADIEGPGIVQHIWMTWPKETNLGCVIRFYWDDEETPSVEAPIAEFFANGHGRRYDVNSLMVVAAPTGGYNCYWPMPFRRRCRITVSHGMPEPLRHFFYQVTYALGPVPDEAAYFHAQWRRTLTTREHPEMTILDGVRGRGHYVGTHVAWNQFSNGWWGEGEMKFFLDGDDESPTICGTGVEDYFGGAWGFDNRTYSTPFLGYPFYRCEAGRVPQHALYRWHVLDPIRFERDLRVTVQALGWWPNGFEPLTDDIATVAYWYQSEPHAPFPALPGVEGMFFR